MQSSMTLLIKLFGNNSNMEGMENMKELIDMITAYNTKNYQRQYIMYTTRMKAMDEVSENRFLKLKMAKM